jgi:N-acetyl sugar amidotransferase
MKTFYNLPKKIIFCKKCVMSNQRPSSYPEFKHTKNREGAKYLNIDPKTGICDACKVSENKKKINWKSREKELLKLLDKHRGKYLDYDCIVPGSGGKDSGYASHILKYKYGMNPLTITWPPIRYTEYGYNNFINWIEKGGFDNLTIKPNGRVMKLLTKLSIINLLHPFQTFVFGQKNLAPKIAKKFNIPLIFYGENEAEYGNPLADNNSVMKSSYFMIENIKKSYLAGVSIDKLIKKYNLSYQDLSVFLPLEKNELKKLDIEFRYLGYYLKWIPQESYYYAVENTGFKARPFRTQGTYSKYTGIDDKIDDLHYYTTYIKFGYGRASHDASQEIRNDHIDRKEALSLVKKFDGEFPDRYFDETLDYLGLSSAKFHELCDKFRSPHIWKKTSNGFLLRHTANKDGTDD